jgi:hypothetical protein
MKLSKLALALGLMGLGTANAASMSYFLDQSNALPDGTHYLQVTLSEIENGVDFWVETLTPLDKLGDGHFGIQQFGFSFTSNTEYEIEGLPRGWRDQSNKQMSEFGRYDIRLKGTGSTRTDDLHFSVLGVGLSDFDDYFAAHVAGFEWCFEDGKPDAKPLSKSSKKGKYDWDEGDSWSDRNKSWRYGKSNWNCDYGDCITSAYFGGGTPSAVPVPAAAWLFGSGLFGLVGFARRKLVA